MTGVQLRIDTPCSTDDLARIVAFAAAHGATEWTVEFRTLRTTIDLATLGIPAVQPEPVETIVVHGPGGTTTWQTNVPTNADVIANGYATREPAAPVDDEDDPEPVSSGDGRSTRPANPAIVTMGDEK